MQRLTRLSLAHPVAVGSLLAVLTAVFGAGLLRLETDVGYRALLGERHPAVARFDAFLERFGGGFPLAAVYRCPETTRCTSVFDDEAVEMAAAVVAALDGEPAVRRVESPATSPLLVPGDDDPRTVRLIEAAPDERTARGWRARNDSLWPRQLVDADGTLGAIVLEVASSKSTDNAAAYAALDRALAPHEARGWVFHRVGGPVEFVVAGSELARDVARLVPTMVALIAVVLLLVFRSLAAAALSLATVGLGVLWSFGVMGWLGWPQNSVTQALAPLLLVIGVCDTLHVLARTASERAQQPERDLPATLVHVAGDVGGACVATTLTTAAAFASFATSGLGSFVRFGAIAALGVLFALLLTFTLLPILAARLGVGSLAADRVSHRWQNVLDRALGVATRRPLSVLFAVTGLAAVCGVGLLDLRVDASFEDLYGEDSQVVRWSRVVGDHLRRPDTLEVELRAPEGADPADPETLRTLAKVGRELAGVEGLGPARSLADAVALAHQIGNDDDPFWRRIPGRPADVREVLDALEEHDPQETARWADLADGHYRVSVEAEKLAQDAMRRTFREVDARLAATLPPGWSAELTGPLAVVRDMIDEIQATQLWSFVTAGGIVLVLCALFLRSVTAAGMAALPTLLPVVVTLGAMGLVGAPLDVGSAMVAAIVIGVAVDDALHLLSQMQKRRRRGVPLTYAMNAAARHVGRAVVTTSGALALGFSSLVLSSWATISHFGALSALAVLGALVAVLFVLPALVSLRSQRRPEPGG
ncbi:MAG: efflux RND transporter permease subunit [Myxococcota bacterium]